MTKQEQRELDEWIAVHGFGWKKVWVRACRTMMRGGHFESEKTCAKECTGCEKPVMRWKHKDGCTSIHHDQHWSPSSKPSHFAEVKREIERRGWSWVCSSSYSLPVLYAFHIVNEKRKGVALVEAETEELAGCLAFKQALERTRAS